MTKRPAKRKADIPSPVSVSIEKHHKAAEGIAKFSFKVMPYSRCSKRGVACKTVVGKKKCGLCVSLGRPCDVTGMPLNSREFLFLVLLAFPRVLIS
jgi:hypothetical protein